MLFDELKQDMKDLKRLQHILTILFEEGWGYYVHKSKLSSNLPISKRIKSTKPINNKEEQAKHLRSALERLGPTFVKLGQLLSLRPDLVPVEYSIELEKLQDNVPPFTYKEAKRII